MRLHDSAGKVKGAGCLINADLIVTCSHVVVKALGHTHASTERPLEPIVVQFPNSVSDARCRARVVEGAWYPVAGAGSDQPGDVALVVLEGETPAPEDAIAAPLGPPVREWNDVPFYAFGFPEHAAGTSVTGVIAGPAGPDGQGGLAGSEWAMLKGVTVTGERILPGFSGAPVWDEQLGVVAGIIVAQNESPEARVGYMIPLRTLAHYLPALAELRRWRLRHENRRDRSALLVHWQPEARGLPTGPSAGEAATGWHFSGRVEALARLSAHLDDEAAAVSLLAVTGAPGSGKSAVLSRLVTLADREYRQTVPEWVLAEAEPRALPPLDAVDLAVHARGLSATDVAGRIVAAAALAVPAPEQGPADDERLRGLGRDLGQELARRSAARPFRLVVDALDEAKNAEQPSLDEPRRIALLLAALATQAGPQRLRCLVGTRPRSPRLGDGVGGDLLRTLGLDPDDGRTTVDLGREPYLDNAAIRRYVDRLIVGTGEEVPPPSAALPGQRRERLVRAIAQAAGSNFLIALLTALAVRQTPDREIVYPKTVGGAFDVYLDNFGARRDRVEALFRALAYAEGDGLAGGDEAWALIARAVGGSAFPPTASDEELAGEIDAFVVADAAYLVQAGARATRSRGLTEQVPLYRIYHQAIIDHLRADRHQERQKEIFLALYHAVPGEGERPAWQQADPYVLRHLLRHALAAGDTEQIDALLEDSTFCVHADPTGFEPRLILNGRSSHAIATAHTIGRAIHRLRIASGPRERAALLGLSARQSGNASLADEFDRELAECDEAPIPAGSPAPRFRWRCRWAASKPESPHFTLTGGTGSVRTVAIGTLTGEDVIVAAGDLDGTVRIWGSDGNPRGDPLRGHGAWVNAVAVGRLAGEDVIVSGSQDQTLRIWAADGSPRGDPLRGHTAGVEAVALGTLAGEDVIVSAGGFDGAVRIWSADGSPRGDPLHGHADIVTAVAVGTLAGEDVIVSGSEDRRVRIWSADGSRRGDPLQGDSGSVKAVAVGMLAGDDVIVSGHTLSTVRIWAADGSPRGDPLPHSGSVYAVAVGKLAGEDVIVSAGTDGTVRIWSADGSSRGDPLQGHTDGVKAVAVGRLAGEDVVVSGSEDRTVRIWAADASRRGNPPQTHAGSVCAVAAGTLAGEEVIVSADDRTARIWTATGRSRGTLQAESVFFHAVAVGTLTGEDVIVAAAGVHETVRIWTVDGRPRGGPLQGHTGSVYAVAVGRLAGEDVIVSAGDDKTVRIWAADGSPRGGPLQGHTGSVYAVAVGRLAGEDVIVSGGLGEMLIWAADGSPLGDPLLGHPGTVHAVAVGTVGGDDAIVSGHYDETVRVWAADGSPRGDPLQGHTGPVKAVAVGKLAGEDVIVSASTDGTVRIWAADGQPSVIAPGGAVAAVALARSSSLLAGGAFGLASFEITLPSNGATATMNVGS